ncbi:MAG: hypothetical protein F4Y03_19055 [Alphaproteobacteria bacterium]|nr:hypothetical protein [Alphaproteobacteria bacterium]
MPQDTAGPGESGGRPQWYGYLQLAVILGAIAVALYFARAPERVERIDRAALAGEERRPVVSVIRPEPTEQSLTLRLTGSVRLKERATVMSEVVGRVVWVSPKFEPGGSIDANEVFIRIDPEEYALKAEEARLAVEELEHALRAAEARNGEAPAAALRLERARVALRLAELQLRRTEISLPFDSRVVSSSVEVGELAGPAEKVGKAAVLGVVYRPEAIRVTAPIEQRDLRHLSPVVGRPAVVRTRTGVYRAEVAGVSSVVAAKSRLASVFLKFSDDLPVEGRPLPRTFAEISIQGPVHRDVFVLPEAAAQANDSVWVVRDGALAAVEPRMLGRVDGGWVVEAFDAGDGVVLGTLPGAREGLAVTTAKPQA